MRPRLGLLLLCAAALLPPPAAIAAADCPLDFSWPNYKSIASACSDGTGHSKCCRYINAALAVSSAAYANAAGTLGVPARFSDACIGDFADALSAKGVLPTAASLCGLGIKIQAAYRCAGMTTVAEMLRSPNFGDVTRSCGAALSDGGDDVVACKRCLNSGLSYLRRLVGEEDNITLNACRDAAFVAVVGHANVSAVDAAGCFFTVQGLSALQANISGTTSPAGLLAPNISPSPLTVQVPVVPPKHHRSYKVVLFPAIGALVTGLAIVLMIVLVLLIRRKGKELEKVEGNEWSFSCVKKGQEGTPTIFSRFSYTEIRKATRNFSTMLGGGGEKGTVFKGQLNDGSVVVIRRLDSLLKQSQREFCKEMEFVGRLHHRHLLGLKGFCLTRSERFQVYEYMENGSLQDQLHSPGKHLLPWKNRIQIAIDVANALEYLHFYCDPPLYHGDVKPSNVLLDRNYLAKLAGCSRARCSAAGDTTGSSTTVNAKVQAAPGYVDPEYVVTQELTPKSDVYSYGVLLLELVTGKAVIQDGSKSLVEWSRELIGTDYRLHELVDPTVADAFDLDELQVVADVIHWCTHRDGAARPSMKQVLRILYERLDPLSGRFARAVEGEEGYYYYYHHSVGGGWRAKGKAGGEAARSSWLPSSSSTSRSHCSRSVLLECNSPEPGEPPARGHGTFTV